MGTFIKGILGGFSGKVGNVVGAFWRGIDYMRSLPRKSTKPPTEAQLKQRLTFALVTGFLRPLGALINIGFQSYKGKKTPMNAALAYHLEKAVTGVYPALEIDFTKVIYSKGNLQAPGSPSIAVTITAKINFIWTNNAPPNTNQGTDLATVLVFNPVRNQYVTLQGAAARTALGYVLSVPADFSGEDVHCWVSFVSANGKEVSDSTYLGEFTVL
jgi:hypothetical protein